MTPVSMMPPVDYCPSCEGRKDESKAFEIGEARAQQAERQSETAPSATPAPGAQLPVNEAPAATDERPNTVATAVQPLLAPDLAVQASHARAFNEAGNGEAEALRLRAAEAYRAP